MMLSQQAEGQEGHLFVESRWELIRLRTRFSGSFPSSLCFGCTCAFSFSSSSFSSSSSSCRVGFPRALGTSSWPHPKKNPLATNLGKTRVG